MGLGAGDCPGLGRSINIVLGHLSLNSALSVHVVGFSLRTPAIDLALLGATGCTVLPAPDMLLYGTPSAGRSVLGVTIPSDAVLLGLVAYVQGVAHDPGVNPGSLTSSDTGLIRVGR